MSDIVTKDSWLKHLHVQVRIWEEKIDPSYVKCRLKKCTLEHIRTCLNQRIRDCMNKDLIPFAYRKEIDHLQNGCFDPKPVEDRQLVTQLLDHIKVFSYLPDHVKKKVVRKIVPHFIQNIWSCTTQLLFLLNSTECIERAQSQEYKTVDQNSDFNMKSWLREMCYWYIKFRDNIQGRVKWGLIGDGFDPNNSHILIEDLVSWLRPRVLTPPCTISRPYQEEFKLLQEFLRHSVLDRKVIQQARRERKVAVGISDVVSKLMQSEDKMERILCLFEPTAKGKLRKCLLALREELDKLKEEETHCSAKIMPNDNQSNHSIVNYEESLDSGDDDQVGMSDALNQSVSGQRTGKLLLTESIQDSDDIICDTPFWPLDVHDDQENQNIFGDQPISSIADFDDNILSTSLHELFEISQHEIRLPLCEGQERVEDQNVSTLDDEMTDGSSDQITPDTSNQIISKHSISDSVVHCSEALKTFFDLGETIRDTYPENREQFKQTVLKLLEPSLKRPSKESRAIKRKSTAQSILGKIKEI